MNKKEDSQVIFIRLKTHCEVLGEAVHEARLKKITDDFINAESI